MMRRKARTSVSTTTQGIVSAVTQYRSIRGIIIGKKTVSVFRYYSIPAAAAKSLQSCPTLCDPTDGSPPGFSIPGILPARTLEWVAISFSNACMHAKLLQLCPTVQPHGQQPTRLLHPWDFPGKSTGVGCHRLLRKEILLFRK